MTKICLHELFYMEQYHVLVSRICMSVNRAAPIAVASTFQQNFLRKIVKSTRVRLWQVLNLYACYVQKRFEYSLIKTADVHIDSVCVKVCARF